MNETSDSSSEVDENNLDVLKKYEIKSQTDLTLLYGLYKKKKQQTFSQETPNLVSNPLENIISGIARNEVNFIDGKTERDFFVDGRSPNASKPSAGSVV